MGLLSELATEYKTLSIVGMAKNAGKTTALNYFIEEAMDEGIRLGITSTGRDGESTDLVTGTDKPSVFLYEDTIVSVPTRLYECASAGLEILKMTKYHTAIGPVLLCRVASSGETQVAGPVMTADHRKMREEMMAFGAEMVLIDGAIDRRSVAAPETSDAIILATGAVLSRNMKKAVEETAHTVGLYGLPKLSAGRARQLILDHGNQDKITIIQKDGTVRILDLKTGLLAGNQMDEAINEETEYVYLPGALTNSVVGDIHPKKLKHVAFVMKDPTRIFINSTDWRTLCKKGFRVLVLENIQVAAVTVNPVAPGGYSFEHEAFLAAMRQALPGKRVMDVKL